MMRVELLEPRCTEIVTHFDLVFDTCKRVVEGHRRPKRLAANSSSLPRRFPAFVCFKMQHLSKC